MAIQNINGMWTLSPSEYRRLKADSEFLSRLEAAGVDNWEGYCDGFPDEEDEI